MFGDFFCLFYKSLFYLKISFLFFAIRAIIIYMLCKPKRKFSPKKLKFFSTLAVSGLIMLILSFFSGIIMNKALAATEKRYLDNCVQVLQGYSVGIQYYLENYHTYLSSIFNEELFEEDNPKEIQKWIIDNYKFLTQDFASVFYVDSNLTGYFSQGNIIDLKNKPYISPDNFRIASYYVSDMFDSELSDTPVFCIEKPYFGKDGRLKGILCAYIEINRLWRIAKNIRIGDYGTAYILDRSGKVLMHPDDNYIGKIFIPKSEKYKNVTSDVTAKEGNGYVETENHLGEPIDLFYARIKNCGWTLSVGFPKKYFEAVHTKYNSLKFMAIMVSLVALVLLLFLDTLISDYFYKNQLIDAIYDPLTKLWTRQKFEKEAAKIMNKYSKARFMLIEADIRGFKFINQNYGEEEADKMIYFFSTLLNKITQEYKGIICHGFADHFTCLLRIQDVREAMNIFKGQTYLLAEQIREYDIPFFPKFGITFAKPSHNPQVTIRDLIGQASFAKSMMKNSMLLPYGVYNPRLLWKVNEEQTLEHNMKDALENQEFFVMYQPKVLLEDDSVVGAEALVRWNNPKLGMIYPDKFIPLFERNGFIVKLDFYVYDKVFKFLDEQIKSGHHVVPVSVNMSRNHNHPEKFMAEFMRLFKKYEIPPNLIQVEIIERSVMDRDTLCAITNSLHEEGFSVAMDDFGSGESSLNMLTKVPVDVLKFDREFLLSSINNKGEMEKKSAKFIKSLIDLSRNLEKKTVFEGVETEAQRNFLRSINCDQVQGYFYSRPLIEEDFVNFVQSHYREPQPSLF